MKMKKEGMYKRNERKQNRTFSAVWLRSSVVTVLFSVKTENVPTGYILFTCIFELGGLLI